MVAAEGLGVQIGRVNEGHRHAGGARQLAQRGRGLSSAAGDEQPRQSVAGGEGFADGVTAPDGSGYGSVGVVRRQTRAVGAVFQDDVEIRETVPDAIGELPLPRLPRHAANLDQQLNVRRGVRGVGRAFLNLDAEDAQ